MRSIVHELMPDDVDRFLAGGKEVKQVSVEMISQNDLRFKLLQKECTETSSENQSKKYKHRRDGDEDNRCSEPLRLHHR
ncbi:hypothetical protein Bca52824_009554 [Brassica carinata]|uniref:Uncharacterized protein n=1 Tax=Brassica carinata TaxID=52824 RepID=A0A8X7WBD7_BRACI|nr:hypothetical protein Bca52824_009554 [Brassica carinata]